MFQTHVKLLKVKHRCLWLKTFDDTSGHLTIINKIRWQEKTLKCDGRELSSNAQEFTQDVLGL